MPPPGPPAAVVQAAKAAIASRRRASKRLALAGVWLAVPAALALPFLIVYETRTGYREAAAFELLAPLAFLALFVAGGLVLAGMWRYLHAPADVAPGFDLGRRS